MSAGTGGPRGWQEGRWEGAEPAARGATGGAVRTGVGVGRTRGKNLPFPATERRSRAPDSGIFSAGGRGQALEKNNHFSPSLQTVLRIVVLGIWDYIENKIEVKTSVHPPTPQPRHPGSWKMSLSHPSWGGSQRESLAAFCTCPQESLLL